MRFFIILSIAVFGIQSFAAKQRPSAESFTAKKRMFSYTLEDKKQVVEGLKLPLKNRLKIYSKKPKTSFYVLKAIAFDEEQSVKMRWRALTSMAAVGKNHANNSIVKASKSKHWYMRNASLLAAQLVESSFAAMIAADLIRDPSLIVRTEAVRTIKNANAKQYKNVLKQQLHSEQNFKNKKSLWVRKHIAEALYKFMDTSDKQLFKEMLYDVDPEIQRFGVLGMERYYQRRITDSKKLAQHVQEWKVQAE
ncbi:MAG: HEAT repeat domain-containing protein [Bdellovibrionales bacterium]